MNKFSRQIFTWIYCIEREGARANSNTKISVSPKIQYVFRIFNVIILAFRHFRKFVLMFVKSWVFKILREITLRANKLQ